MTSSPAGEGPARQEPGLRRRLARVVALLADLRFAIALLVLVAIASGLGTAIPQREAQAFYRAQFDQAPWLGVLDGSTLLALELDHVYSSHWFLALLACLGLSLLLCSWRRQWPALQAGLRWIDYRTPRQLSKLALAATQVCPQPAAALQRLDEELTHRGWAVRRQDDRLAARRGVVGRVGPLLVHTGLIVLLVGAAWGNLAGQRLEQFLAPGRSLELIDRQGSSQLTLELKDFRVERDPSGRPEQFRSGLALRSATGQPLTAASISVNHPLRYRGITIYQADWALAAIALQLGRSPVLQLPLQSLPQLGEQIWGLVLPTRPDGSEPVLLTVDNEQGPVQVFSGDATLLGQLSPGGPPLDIQGLPLRLDSILPASGLLLKRDPGVPLVYLGFAIALLGGGLSLVATRQLWAIADADQRRLHLAGLCNRNPTALAGELPRLLEACSGAGASVPSASGAGDPAPVQTPQQG